MGTMEIESALVSCTELVAEAAVVGRPDETTGEAICAFVVLKRSRPTGDEAKKIANELRNWVAKEIGPIAKPKDIRFGDNLPKTRSRQDHAPPAALAGQGRADHAGHQHAGEPGDPRSSWARPTDRGAAGARRSREGALYFDRPSHPAAPAVQRLGSALTFGLAGIGTGPQAPTPPL